MEKVYSIPLRDLREGAKHRIRHPPTVHIARGFDERLPFLSSSKRPLICISDWQYETPTQEHFWEQACRILEGELGESLMERAIVLVAGDMASADNTLLGSASDAVPKLHWLHETFSEKGDVFMIYGNHDLMAKEHLEARSSSSLESPCLLPHGATVSVPLNQANQTTNEANTCVAHNTCSRPAAEQGGQKESGASKTTPKQNFDIPQGLTKQERAALYAKMKFEKKAKPPKLETRNKEWRRNNPEQAALLDQMQSLHGSAVASRAACGGKGPVVRIGAVHGIPSSHNQGMRKIERGEYFQALEQVCGHASAMDILVTHSNAKLPFHNKVRGDDAPRIFENFQKSSAYLHVHGHQHTEPAVAVLENGKVVVNSDCRVIAFVPSDV